MTRREHLAALGGGAALAASGAGPSAWWPEARLGMFIHWGLYSLLGRGEQVLFREHLQPSRYRKLAERFTAPKFNAREWAAMARDAGMRYMVLTAKHHDGFCLFESAASRFTSAATAARRDFVGEYAEAVRAAGLRVGLYYSLADWSRPEYFSGPRAEPSAFAAFVDYIHTQVKEICSRYGRIDELWFDGGWPHTSDDWRTDELEQTIRKLQPGVMINDRLHGGGAGNVRPGAAARPRKGDFVTAEQKNIGGASRLPRESCHVTQHYWWGYMAGENHWKTPAHLVYLLAEAAGWDSNLLLNVGPKGDGRFPPEAVKQLAALGQWTRRNGEALYGSAGASRLFEFLTTGHMTARGNTLFLWVLWWHGRELHLCGLRNQVRSARILGSGGQVSVRREGEHIYLGNLPAEAPDPYCTVIALELDGPPAALSWAGNRLWGDDAAAWAEWART